MKPPKKNGLPLKPVRGSEGQRLTAASGQSLEAFLRELCSIPICEIMDLHGTENNRSDDRVGVAGVFKHPSRNKKAH